MMLEVQCEQGSILWVPRLSGQSNAGSVVGSFGGNVLRIECSAYAEFRVFAAKRIRLCLVATTDSQKDGTNITRWT